MFLSYIYAMMRWLDLVEKINSTMSKADTDFMSAPQHKMSLGHGIIAYRG